jgi:hypothetical protein
MFASREGADELQGKENVAKMTAETPMHPTKLNFDSILLPKVPAKVQMLTPLAQGSIAFSVAPVDSLCSDVT